MAKAIRVGTVDGIKVRERHLFGRVLLEEQCKRCGLWFQTLKHTACPNCKTLDKII